MAEAEVAAMVDEVAAMEARVHPVFGSFCTSARMCAPRRSQRSHSPVPQLGAACCSTWKSRNTHCRRASPTGNTRTPLRAGIEPCTARTPPDSGSRNRGFRYCHSSSQALVVTRGMATAAASTVAAGAGTAWVVAREAVPVAVAAGAGVAWVAAAAGKGAILVGVAWVAAAAGKVPL